MCQRRPSYDREQREPVQTGTHLVATSQGIPKNKSGETDQQNIEKSVHIT